MSATATSKTSRSQPSLFLSIWSIRHLMKRQPLETLELIHSWGFSTVEVAAYLDWSATEFREKLTKHKLQVCGLAGPPLKTEHDPAYYVTWAREYLAVFDTRTLILQCPVRSPENGQEAIDNEIATLLIKVAQDLAPYKRRVSYHCYPHDFALINGQSFLSRLFGRDDVPANLGLQLDTFWLNHGETEPSAYARFPVHSVHINERDEEGRCCLLGTHEERCAKYLRPLTKRQQPIDWILENDPSDKEALSNDKAMVETIEQCVMRWPEFWRSIA